jgi:hypothetical protein
MHAERHSLLAPGPLALIALVLAAALSRVLPHPPNFTPVAAMALFAGAYFARRGWALLVPVLALLLSDLVLGMLHGGTYLAYYTTAAYLPSLLANYASMLLAGVIGFGLRGRVTSARVLAGATAASVAFFVISNFAVWVMAQGAPYPGPCKLGLGPCYVAGIPFFQWTLLGTVTYAALMFGGFAWLRGRVPALRAETA